MSTFQSLTILRIVHDSLPVRPGKNGHDKLNLTVGAGYQRFISHCNGLAYPAINYYTHLQDDLPDITDIAQRHVHVQRRGQAGGKLKDVVRVQGLVDDS